MCLSPRARVYLAALTVACVSLPARAADLNSLLPDDTNFIVSVNVKQILQTPLFAKNKKQVEDLLKLEPVQMVLKDTGFEPLKDIDRVVVVTGPSSFAEEGTFEGDRTQHTEGPMLLAHGRFDQEKIQAKFNQLAKDMPEMLKVHGIGKADVLEVKTPGSPLFLAVADKETFVLCPRRDQLEDVLEKAAGDRKTEFKSPGIAKLIKGMDLKQSIQVAGTEEMIMGSSVRSMSQCGKTTTTVKLERLGDSGIESLVGSGNVADKLEGKVSLNAKDADSAKKLAELFDQSLARQKQHAPQLLANQKDLVPLFEVMNTIKVGVKDKVATIEGHASAEAVQAFFKARLFGFAAPSPDR